jgi:hypothetical protein
MAESTRLMGRNGAIWQRYCRGATQEDIALEFDISQTTVSQVITAVADSVPETERRQLIAQEVDFFRQTRFEVMKLWDAKPTPVTAGKDGEVVRDPATGEVVYDHSGRLAALDRAIRISERMHKLTGLESALKLDVNANEVVAARVAAEEAAAYVHGGGTEQP